MAERAEGVRSSAAKKATAKAYQTLELRVALTWQQGKTQRAVSQNSLRSRQMQKRLNFMKQRKLGKTRDQSGRMFHY